MLLLVEPVTRAIINADFIGIISDRLGINEATDFSHAADSGIDAHDSGCSLTADEFLCCTGLIGVPTGDH